MPSDDFSTINFFKKFFQEYHWSVNQSWSTVLVGLIWIPTDWKCYQSTCRTSKVDILDWFIYPWSILVIIRKLTDSHSDQTAPQRRLIWDYFVYNCFACLRNLGLKSVKESTKCENAAAAKSNAMALSWVYVHVKKSLEYWFSIFFTSNRTVSELCPNKTIHTSCEAPVLSLKIHFVLIKSGISSWSSLSAKVPG